MKMAETSPEVKGFFLHLSQCDALFNLPPESVVNALKMCRDYCMGKEPTCDDPVAVCAFGLMRPSLDKSLMRAENGRKGGEANASKTKQTLANASKGEANASKGEANASKGEANASKAKQTLAKEQRTKNKELELENINTDSCAEPDKPPHAPEADAVISLPLVTGGMHHVVQADVDHWQELFPGVDVPGELRRMLAWAEAHPRQRKTPTGIAKFIVGWLDREQNQSRPSRASPDAAPRKTWAEIEEERNRAEFLRMTGGCRG